MRYNEAIHLALERWNLSRPRRRYMIRKFRRLRKMAKAEEIPLDLPITGGEMVTRLEHGKATRKATGFYQQTLEF